MCLASNALWPASADAFSSNLLIMSLIKPLTFPKRIVAVGDIGVCRGINTRCKLCQIRSSSRFWSVLLPNLRAMTALTGCPGVQRRLSSLRSRPSPSQAPPIPRTDSCWCGRRNLRLFVWIARQSCIVSSNAAVSSARASSVIFKSAVN